MLWPRVLLSSARLLRTCQWLLDQKMTPLCAWFFLPSVIVVLVTAQQIFVISVTTFSCHYHGRSKNLFGRFTAWSSQPAVVQVASTLLLLPVLVWGGGSAWRYFLRSSVGTERHYVTNVTRYMKMRAVINTLPVTRVNAVLAGKVSVQRGKCAQRVALYY